jgi:II/X family phage/plasmid replication protein
MMIDLLRLRVPFLTDYYAHNCVITDTSQRYAIPNSLIRKMCDAEGIPINGYGLQPDGSASVLSCPWDSLPSSYSGVGLKINHAPMMGLPAIELKASPAKVMQGHNIYGNCDYLGGIMMLMSALFNSFPDLFFALDWHNAEIRQIDITASLRLPSQTDCIAMLEYLKTASYGQTLPRSHEQNTIYFGATDSKHKKLKIYNKQVEYDRNLKLLAKKSAYCDLSKKQYEILSDQTLIDFSRNLVRFEPSIMYVMLRKQFKTINAWDLAYFFEPSLNSCSIDQSEPILTDQVELDTCYHLWTIAMSDLIKAAGDINYRPPADAAILELLMLKYGKQLKPAVMTYNAVIRQDVIVTPAKMSYAKAHRLFGFYKRIVNEGFNVVKDTTSKSSFYRQLDEITDADIGVTITYLKSITAAGAKNVVPFSRVIQVDFSNQRPAYYQAPDWRKQVNQDFIDTINRLNPVFRGAI